MPSYNGPANPQASDSTYLARVFNAQPNPGVSNSTFLVRIYRNFVMRWTWGQLWPRGTRN